MHPAEPKYPLASVSLNMRIADDRVLDGVVFIGGVDPTRNKFTPLGTGFLTIKSDGGYLFGPSWNRTNDQGIMSPTAASPEAAGNRALDARLRRRRHRR